MTTHATALFADRHAAHAAVEQLVQAGFSRDEISVVMSEDAYQREYGPLLPERSGIRPARHAGVLGAIVTSLVAFTPRAGTPSIRAAGPLVLALVRAGDDAFVAALVAAGLPEHEARFVERGVARGAIAVAVRAGDERLGTARQLLALSGGEALRAA